MAIALFGTSADPPTIGHQAILRWLSDNYDLVVVWVSDNPFKSHRAPLTHRIEMVRVLIQATDFPRANVELHPEISHPRTLLTLHMAQQIWPAAHFTLVVGADIVPQLPSWYRAQELLAQVALVVIPRRGYTLTETQLQTIAAHTPQITIADLAVPGVSSSSFRDHKDRSGMLPAVLDYIDRWGLYE
ncbi:MAG: nicotinate-nucleotide adenylyltransferase [Pseudanabaenaceae cyanobacterium SKYGB_i_bin29]|nr:nicotinate-nucleotide adenylyltransferase [Pseudanabaenaceae cyanobacterium SKYG29]MDW8420539.1 nicotinate-nucleotide adenylyltransferase [Pseudanabaenaceae cyanobacterium SKYGB_i_bin29]